MGEKRKQRIRMHPTIEDWSIRILKEEGKPLNYREITSRVQEYRPIGGKTPENTVYSVLLRSSKIKKVGGGMFTLPAQDTRPENITSDY
jgi:hypothetical protein